MYFARVRVGGKLIRPSLTTDVLTVAQMRMPEFERVTLRVLRWQERDNRMLTRQAEIVA